MLIEVTDSDVDGVINSFGLVIIDLWAPWCRPCNLLSPVIKSLAEHNTDITIGKLNTQENPSIPTRFNVSAIPTILFFKDGRMVKQLLGYHTEPQLQSFVNQLK